MEQYTGTKNILARPMNRADYNDYRGWDLPADEEGSDEGYLVEYTDGGASNHPDHEGYISWSPAVVFDKAYNPSGTHVERMAIELRDLTDRILKLKDFKTGDVYTSLSHNEKRRIRVQHAAMLEYHLALSERFTQATK